jgi:hypothetical protein
MSSSVIRIERGRAMFASLRKLSIWVDKAQAGAIARNSSVDFNVVPGRHTVAVTMDWCTCRPVEVDLAAGELVTLVVTFPSMFTSGLKMFLMSSSFFTLTPQAKGSLPVA